MKLNLTLSRKGFILVLVPLVFELLFLGVLGYLLHQSELQAKREARSRAIVSAADATGKAIVECGSAAITYIGTRSAAQLDRYNELNGRLEVHISELNRLVKGNLRQEQAAERIAPLAHKVLKIFKELQQSDPTNLPVQFMAMKYSYPEIEYSSRKVMMELQSIVDQENQFIGFEPAKQLKDAIKYLVFFGVVANIAIGLGLAVFFNKSTRIRLAILMDNTTRLAKNEPLRPVLSGSDEIAHLDQVFHEMADALKEVDRMKREFVAMITHDLRSPLTGIMFSTGLLGEGAYGELTQRAKDQLVTIEGAVEQMLALINDLLFVEKLQSGKMQMDLRNVPLSRVFERSVKPLLSIANHQNLTLLVPDTSIEVFADEDKLARVMINLVSNAIKFSPEGGIVCISTDVNDGTVEVKVRDQGPGIPAESQQSVFERFKQVEQKDGKQKSGTGLGLAICKDIIEGHDGTIGVESAPGNGSTFWFRISVAKNDPETKKLEPELDLLKSD